MNKTKRTLEEIKEAIIEAIKGHDFTTTGHEGEYIILDLHGLKIVFHLSRHVFYMDTRGDVAFNLSLEEREILRAILEKERQKYEIEILKEEIREKEEKLNDLINKKK